MRTLRMLSIFACLSACDDMRLLEVLCAASAPAVQSSEEAFDARTISI